MIMNDRETGLSMAVGETAIITKDKPEIITHNSRQPIIKMWIDRKDKENFLINYKTLIEFYKLNIIFHFFSRKYLECNYVALYFYWQIVYIFSL